MRVVRLLVVGVVALGVVGCGDDGNDADDDTEPVADRVQVLIDAASETIIGQPIAYPDGMAQVTMSVVTLQPGEQTGGHLHEAPLAAYVLDGELTVDYGPEGARTFVAGDAFLEALEVTHNGTNTGDEPLRVLVVNIGSDAVENSVLVE